MVGLVPTRARPTLRVSRQGRAAFGTTTGTSSSLATTVTGGRRRFPVPMLGTVSCSTATALFTGTTATVPSVFRFVASGIKGGA